MLKRVNFNTVAPYYDFLSWLVFGNNIKKAQIDLLRFIPENSNILIVGGGTGWILDEITKIHSAGLTITYVDSSSKMIALSKRQNIGQNHVKFFEESIENINLADAEFDILFTPFLLDLFTQDTCQSVCKKLQQHIKKGGLWLYCDFYVSAKSKLWQKAMLRFMYLFFKITCRVNTTQLPVVSDVFLSYPVMSKKNYCKNFIVTSVYAV
jgi:ubiquinone/menaquinone biosynthesis C-methylase UbiE